MANRYEQVPDRLWQLIEPLMPAEEPKPYGGRPRKSWRAVMNGVHYKLWTGRQWEAIPSSIINGKTCHRRYQELVEAGVFDQILELMPQEERSSIPMGDAGFFDGESAEKRGLTGPNPTDRAKSGVKLHVLTDERGIPLSAGITAANVNDIFLVAAALDHVRMRAPRGPGGWTVSLRLYKIVSPVFPTRVGMDRRRLYPRGRRRGIPHARGNPLIFIGVRLAATAR